MRRNGLWTVVVPLLAALGAACGAAEEKSAPNTKQDPPMICRNLTKGNALVSRLVVATSSEDRRRGLLGRSSLEAGEGMLLDPCMAVHTIGMKFAIDIVFLDKQRRVVAICPEVEPGVLHRGSLKARSTLELPAGAAAAKRLEVGDSLQIARADEPEAKQDNK